MENERPEEMSEFAKRVHKYADKIVWFTLGFGFCVGIWLIFGMC